MKTNLDRGPWASSGVETIRPDVHRIPLPLPNDGLRAVNVYVLEDGDDLILIDGGWAISESLRALEVGLAALGHDLGEVSHILVTHVHRDHYTQAVELRRLVGSRVYLGAGERPGLDMLDEVRTDVPVTSLDTLRRAGADQLAERLLREMDWSGFEASVWEKPDHWLRPGVVQFERHALRVVPTPGHTRGHVVYLDEERGLLFSGDHVLPHITPSIGFELTTSGRPLADYLDSLHLITTFADAELLPAHGPAGGSAHARATELLEHHETRLEDTLNVLGRRASDAFTAARDLMWTRHEVPFAELNAFNQMLAVNETAAHLDVLAERGQLAVEIVAGVKRYARTDGIGVRDVR
ncbi:MBL fold metallo-hydrolase [Saccharopolyspora sp. TS4A08]|uniref:MBL fold metallo-hydrolase n=1 Tax=Saccharopolyspora ipomoeae TaxID=3042027 RepID=A0ABT6PRL6_9PSEU|nr:MBL fold metallo-hydrolase [Saccharopolyspora sp. TS4A08]MDI2030532.1 MBL fold metallo-hydrolase [Saccharopolyspora sp. TS4A08]